MGVGIGGITDGLWRAPNWLAADGIVPFRFIERLVKLGANLLTDRLHKRPGPWS
jgi:hypothetical protein